jgi:NAD(P)-dependent dehydrogenase (short-subunit alcohol dehydrogenase family)
MWTLVTGGAKRLGAALCLALAEKGRSVVVHYNHREKEALDIVAQCQAIGGQAAAIQGDFSSTAGVKDFIQRYLEQFSDTEILINNVGNYLTRSALQTSIEEWTDLFQVNLHTPFLLAQALAPSLIQQQGQIINIGMAGIMRHTAHTYSTAYNLTKEGLLGLTLALARELASQKVRVNMVSPAHLSFSVDLPENLAELPMKRPAYCWEVCRVVNFLLDPASAYITGQNIEVAGGVGLA